LGSIRSLGLCHQRVRRDENTPLGRTVNDAHESGPEGPFAP
jgi:hypothetical protein